MKKFIFPLFLILILGFTACSSDDDSTSTSGDVEGTWILTYEQFSFSAEDIELSGSAVGLTNEDTVTFHEDGTYSTTHSSTSSIDGSFVWGDVEMPIDNDDVEFLDETGNWSKQGNKLIIINDEVEQIFKITKLNDSKLEIELTELINTGGDTFVDYEAFDEMNAVIKFKR